MSASTWWTVWFCWLWGCWFVFSRIMFNRLCIRIIRRTATGIILRRLFPTQNLLSDAESNICKYNAVIINDITLFWRDKSYAEGRLRDRKLARICKWSCRPKKKKQTSENMAMRFFANSHLLTRIFAHSCIRCEASAFVLQSLSLQIAFSCSFLFSSLQMFIL